MNREQYYLTLLEPIYNLTLQVVANKGQKRSEEARSKASKTERTLVEMGFIASRKTYIYNIETFTLCAELNSAKDARKLLKVTTGSNLDSKIIKKKYIIRYSKYSSMLEFVNDVYKNVKFPKTIGKYIIVKNHDMINYYYTNTECIRDLGLTQSQISAHRDATILNPYRINDNLLLYYSDNYESLPVPSSEIPFVPEFDEVEIKFGSV